MANTNQPFHYLRLISMSRFAFALLVLACNVASLGADEQEKQFVGVQKDGSILVPTNQVLRPAGKKITFPGRPVDLALAEEGRILVVKNMKDLLFIDIKTAKIKQALALPRGTKKVPGAGFSVVGLLVRGQRVYASDAHGHVRVAERNDKGRYQWKGGLATLPPKVGGAAHPAGLAFGKGKNDLWVTTTRGNTVQLINLSTGKLQAIPVGVAPYTVMVPREDRCYVSNWGGDPPRPGDPVGQSSGTPIRIDPRTGGANQGTVSVLGKEAKGWKLLRSIQVGLHPSGMALSPDKRWLYVANANSDTVSVIDTSKDEAVETILCRPEARLPFGSGSNALAVSPDGNTLYVANGTNNCVAVVRLNHGGKGPSKVLGLIPTGWYPGALALSSDGKKLLIANVKGHGSLSQPRPTAKGKNSHDHLGSVSIIDLPDEGGLAKHTQIVNKNNRLAYSLAGLEKPRKDVKPVPIPARHGEPSVFKHVIYIIKENRTYDQVFGDMKEGKGDPKLCIFGEKVTPNHHKLAREFVLLDNFSCSGVLSADGHFWANASYVTDYLEKAFGGFTRSYPDDASDPLAFPSSGALWANALQHKKTLRMFGESVREIPYTPKGTTWTDLFNDYKNNTRKVKITIKPSIKALAPYTHSTYPYFPLTAPDVYRAQLFIKDLAEFEKKGAMPNLIIMSLPCDHTDGTRPGFPTPRAMVADNDLALGQIVEAVSKSKFWKDTCILTVEDDPQDGFDHIDGHRTVALAISPYTKRKHVDSTCYNQTGMVKTMELILGLPPMNQLDLSATAMRHCFQDKPDLTPYTAAKNQIALNEMNKPLKALKGRALYWAKKSLELDLDHADAADEDQLNRILWFSVRGDEPYPESYVGRR
jgi:YVTN family beta-propeller protein